MTDSTCTTSPDNGSILLFILISILLISGVVYHYYTPYRQALADAQMAIREETGQTMMYSLENITTVLLPRIDMNLYREFRHLNRGEPLILTFQWNNKVGQIQITSRNNCINLTRTETTDGSETLMLHTLLKRLSRMTLQSQAAGERVFAMLEKEHTCITGAKNCEDSLVERSHDDRLAFTSLLPWLCNNTHPGQRIDINAINEKSLPVLQALLMPYTSSEAITRAINNRGNLHWDNPAQFISALKLSAPLPAGIRGALVTESDLFTLEIRYPAKGTTDFYSRSDIQLSQGRAELVSRRLLMDDSN